MPNLKNLKQNKLLLDTHVLIWLFNNKEKFKDEFIDRVIKIMIKKMS